MADEGKARERPRATWMTNDGPGDVLAIVRKAQQEADTVAQRGGDNMRYMDADEAAAVGKQAVLDAGGLYQCTLSDPVIGSVNMAKGAKDQMYVRAILRIIAPSDGSYVETHGIGLVIPTAMGLYGAAMNTRARKSVWIAALGLTTGASDEQHRKPEPPEELPEEVEYQQALMEGCQTKAELREVTGTPEYKAIRGKWRAQLRMAGRHRLDWLTRVGERRGNGPMVHPDELSGKAPRGRGKKESREEDARISRARREIEE